MEYLVVAGIGVAWGLLQLWRGGLFGRRRVRGPERSRARARGNDGIGFSWGSDSSSCGGGGGD